MFKRIHKILTSYESLTRAPKNRNLHIKVNYALTVYENEKAKSAHYAAQLIDLNVPDEQ